jgi:hypothetical protein
VLALGRKLLNVGVGGKLDLTCFKLGYQKDSVKFKHNFDGLQADRKGGREG